MITARDEKAFEALWKAKERKEQKEKGAERTARIGSLIERLLHQADQALSSDDLFDQLPEYERISARRIESILQKSDDAQQAASGRWWHRDNVPW